MGFREDRIKRKYYALYERDFKYSDCVARGGNQISIKPNGDITICHGYWNSKENEIGNINEINISDISKQIVIKNGIKTSLLIIKNVKIAIQYSYVEVAVQCKVKHYLATKQKLIKPFAFIVNYY